VTAEDKNLWVVQTKKLIFMLVFLVAIRAIDACNIFMRQGTQIKLFLSLAAQVLPLSMMNKCISVRVNARMNT